jgi:hypothetical protein
MKHIPHSEELPVPKPPENLSFTDDNSNSDEDHRQWEGDSDDYDPTFEASSSSYEPHLLIQGNVDNFIRDLNLSKNKLNS